MRSSVLTRLPLAVPLVLLAGALPAPNASANGPCGQNGSDGTACAVDSPATVFGSLTTAYEHDYYRFYARKGTHLSVTLTDMEPPECEQTYSLCGVIEAALQNTDGAEIDHSEYTEPVDEVYHSSTLTHTIERAGTYYITIYGFLGIEAAGRPAPNPYRLTVHASPAVYWPRSPLVSRAGRHTHGHKTGH
jgi:hypothetical protein